MGSRRIGAVLVLSGTLAAWPSHTDAQSGAGFSIPEPQRQTIISGGEEREFFVRLPATFDGNKQYWLIAVIHGAGGNGRQPGWGRYWPLIQEAGINAILVTPSLKNDVSTWFPSLGEGNVLIQMISELQKTYRLRSKILLAGFSGGKNFVHRFTFDHASMIFACAAHSGGSWTTPDGRFLVKGLGEIHDARIFASRKSIPESSRPGREQYLDDAAVTEGTRKLPSNTPRIPFLVMCGTRDAERIDNAKEFARSLEEHGFPIETGWPDAGHSLTEDFNRRTVLFFAGLTKTAP